MAMLKIWGRASSSNVQKVLWCCAELDLPFERIDLGGPFGGNRDPEYLQLNPNGLVPTVKDGDLIMWESNTICRYLASTRNGERLYPRDPAARTHVERWWIGNWRWSAHRWASCCSASCAPSPRPATRPRSKRRGGAP
jgi:glutathione S-transferase